MDGKNLKRWKCANGHVLGVVERAEVRRNGARPYYVARLMLFREAVDEDGERMEDVDVMAVIEGTTLDVRCSVCGGKRSWWIGADALERLVRRGQEARAQYEVEG